ncbi:MAG: hypothetical protein ISR69_01805 [Gammaproteobacteria bacterium]|nr:hypothetical protein [Gammaproteobacteria bacterium]
MKLLVRLGLCIGLAVLAVFSVGASDAIIQHNLTLKLEPKSHFIEVTDEVLLPEESPQELIFLLHSNLSPNISEGNTAKLTKIASHGFYTQYKLNTFSDSRSVVLQYSGKIYHPLDQSGDTPGLISEKGIFLAGSSYWYPYFIQYPIVQFDMKLQLPSGWRSVSQGTRQQQLNEKNRTLERWLASSDQEEIYLIAAKFKEYSSSVDGISAHVFLREADEQLANKYLRVTHQYLNMYEQLIGQYPYTKFALVENFWESGFGMPSFTLLGSRVIRFPFIIYSSYPHEILHNWWGNSVYIDFETGNWSEGLTAYLADHLIKEQSAKGRSYRLQTLQKYRDFASKGKDFALKDFTARHNSVTEAVGYGKTLMLFHMLRKKLGDDLFKQALQQFYVDYKFNTAGFDDLNSVFNAQSGLNLDSFFKQWVSLIGAPKLAIKSHHVTKKDSDYELTLTLEQRQTENIYNLDVPLAISLKGVKDAVETVVSMSQQQQSYRFTLSAEPIRIDVDPNIDLFRHLAIKETPAAFTQIFGSSKLLLVLPRQSDAKLSAAWQQFAINMTNAGSDVASIVWDDEIDQLPLNKEVVVLGWANRFADYFSSELTNYGSSLSDSTIHLLDKELAKENNSIALVTRFGKGSQSRAFIATDNAKALSGLSRKLPHYHKYSYLAFSGAEPNNHLKGRWSVTDSPMTIIIKKSSKMAKLKSTPALIQYEEASSY